MLTLPIKEQWFRMILNGEKKEEYREIKPYYISRFNKLFSQGFNIPIEIRFRNGYSKNSPSFTAECTLRTGTGKVKWGAESNKKYYILNIIKITSVWTGSKGIKYRKEV